MLITVNILRLFPCNLSKTGGWSLHNDLDTDQPKDQLTNQPICDLVIPIYHNPFNFIYEDKTNSSDFSQFLPNVNALGRKLQPKSQLIFTDS